MESNHLNIRAVVGFTGGVPRSLLLHPDNTHLIYPLGSVIVLRNVVERSQTFLRGHDNEITTIVVSKTGRLIASGQKTFMGFQADIILWDFESRTLLQRLKLHKVLIASLSFSPNEAYLASQGGQDDKNMLVIWDCETGRALYGSGNRQVVVTSEYFNQTDERLMTVQQNGLQIMTVDKVNKKIIEQDVKFSTIKRVFTCIAIEKTDQYCYVGTKTGDIFEISIPNAQYTRIGPIKRLYSLGVTCLRIMPSGDLLVGGGDGKLSKIGINNFIVKSESEVLGAPTSIAFTGDYTHFFCGTSQSNIYWVDSTKLEPELRNTCHAGRINDVAFPFEYSDVFATCSLNDIRIWNTNNRQEMLRIQVPNLECYCVSFSYDGKSIISGWSDGKLRVFLPQSGKLKYVINDAHVHGVTAVAPTKDNERIISGGSQGQIRIWKIGKQTQSMEASMKEHRGRVWSIQLTANNEMAVSSSSDGSCIIWNLKSHTRCLCLFESTIFKQVLYHPDESQLLTAGSDRKITYWEKFDGQAIRSLDGSEDKEINTIDITKEGMHFVSGGEDKVLKLWSYDEGACIYTGLGHSGGIMKVKFSSDQKLIASVGSEGAVFLWDTPKPVYETLAKVDIPTLSKGMTRK